MDKKAVIEYEYCGYKPMPNPLEAVGRAIRVYPDGSVEQIDLQLTWRFELVDSKILKTVSISPDKVREYAERLEQLGFFNLKNKHVEVTTSELQVQLKKKLTLRYKGRSNEVTYLSYHPPSPEIDSLAHELFELVE